MSRENNQYKEKIEKNLKWKLDEISGFINEMDEIKTDMSCGIQRYPLPNDEIMKNIWSSYFDSEQSVIDAKYSLGNSINDLVNDFKNSIEAMSKMHKERLFYLEAMKMVSLGILLETDDNSMEKIATTIEKSEIKDVIIDYLLGVRLKNWSRQSKKFEKEKPYRELVDIINAAWENREKASRMITKYMDKKWFKGHFDYGYKNTQKEMEYVGLWSYETAALVKILQLDDSLLKDNPHYPYDLAHYKNTMIYEKHSLDIPKKKEKEYVYGIHKNPELENMIPLKCHALVNTLITDYQEMEAKKFYTKYKKVMELDEIWCTYKEFKEDNEENNLLGTLIVFLLEYNECVLQLDYNEDIVDYKDDIENLWGEEKTKLVNYNVGNDQYYYALIPQKCDVEQLYEVVIETV